MKKLAKYIIEEKSVYLFYPTSGRGNAVDRIITAHTEDFWWDKCLTGYDDDYNFIQSPLDYTENSKGQYFSTAQAYCKTIVHFPHLMYFLHSDQYNLNNNITYDSIQTFLSNELESFDIQNKKLLKSFLDSGKKIVVPSHLNTNTMYNLFQTNVPIIHLWADKDYFEGRNFYKKNIPKTFSIFFKPYLSEKNILNIEVSKLFSDDWYEYSNEYDKLYDFLNFKKSRKNAVRAFILAYLERNKIFKNYDDVIFQEIEKRKNEQFGRY